MSGQKNSLHNANEMPAATIAPKSLNQKESFVAFYVCKEKIPFLPLYREPSDSLFWPVGIRKGTSALIEADPPNRMLNKEIALKHAYTNRR